MQRDVEIIPLNGTEELVIACDNSGAIGMKPMDEVAVSYEIVSYYCFRVAWMECMSAGAIPLSVMLQNFCGNEAWTSLVDGIYQGMREIGTPKLPITGSTESNFTLLQSAISVTVLGKRRKKKEPPISFSDQIKVAVIGSPLVGNEVIDQKERIAPIGLFQWFCQQKEVLAVMPVGSKGVSAELKQMFTDSSLQFDCEMDMKKSAGPSTCFIVVYRQDGNDRMERQAGEWFHPVKIIF
ncbi:MAG TPA: LPXTG cell wall anchor domain-containing protein [Bacillales bacterium]|nr:LPXTG cell wall anchor domain-containing protein [Bacillales bacterium]